MTVTSTPEIFGSQDGPPDTAFGAGASVTSHGNHRRAWLSSYQAALARSVVNTSDWLQTEFRTERFVVQYGFAILLVAAATGTTDLLELLTGRVLTFPYYVAVVISTWFGIGPGLLAVILAAQVVSYFWVPPIYSLGVDAQNLPWFLVFVTSTLISLVWTWQRRRAERSLEVTVARRTGELLEANAALRNEIAERQAAEAELQEAQAEVARTLRLTTVAETAAAIAHETNQPLAAIAANASACMRSLSREPPLLELARDAAGCIVDDANRAAEVIARVRALLNKEGPKHQPVDVNRTIENVLALTRGAIDRQGISLRLELADRLPDVLGDPIQLQQVLLNLVTNGIDAISAAAKGPRLLTVRSALDEAGAVIVTVQDSGGGIDSKQANRIFESFYTTKPNGIGVGLSISRSIIEAHGGRLWLASAAPSGARFCFALPVVAGPATQ